MRFDAVDDVFRSAVEKGVFPGAVVLVAAQGRVILHRPYGSRALLPRRLPMTGDTLFDLSSLTKPVATTTALMLLVRDRTLRLDDPVASVVPTFGRGGENPVTFRCLLNHTSGLPAWRPYYREFAQVLRRDADASETRAARMDDFWRRLDEEPLSEDPGKKVVYSDLGFMILGRAIECATGMRLDAFCKQVIFSPLGLESTFFVDLRGPSIRPTTTPPFAATEDCPWRHRVLCGEVHDDNAFAMGGVAGHAGLFSNAPDMNRFLHCLRECYYDRNPSFLPGDLVRSFLAKSASGADSSRALGWDTPSIGGSASGRWFSEKTVGHLGFTGTSVWWDLERDIYVVILTNRVHPRRENNGIKEFRPLAHDTIMETVLR